MPLAWTTPDAAPGSEICRALFIPSGEDFEGAARGALLPLAFPENWEQVGMQTPETCADAFAASLARTFAEWRSCLYAGQIIWFAGVSAPSGTLVCDGALYLRDDYSALFSAIGVLYGSTSGDNFRVPNLAGRANFGSGVSPEGTTRNVGDTGGTESVTLSESEMPSHDHSVHSHLSGLAVSPGELPVTTPDIISGSTGNTGGDQAHENMPPFIVLMPCIVTGL